MKEKVLDFWQSHQKYAPATFFALGFIFDILTLGRIDHWLTMVQQGIYLLVITALTSLLFLDHDQPLSPPKWLKLPWEYRKEILHFFIGALLSAYTIFYFKSASLFTSFAFLLILLIILVVNELPQFHRLGLEFKFALLSLCLISFFSYIFPIFLGSLGFIPLLLSTGFSLFIIAILGWIYSKFGIDSAVIRNTLIRPALIIVAVFLSLYSLRIIPPVPLSLQYIGVYHKIEKDKDRNFLLYHERPWWKFWHNGDQSFLARNNDSLMIFARIFSPTNFTDDIHFHWLRHDDKWGWQTMDNIKIRISGGRNEGFRAYASKTNFTPGDWRVQVETQDNREIGRISFSVDLSEDSGEREFQIDKF